MTLQVGFILLPGFSLLSLGAATATLAVANELGGEPRYRMRMLALAGVVARAQCGTLIATEAMDEALSECQVGLVIADQAIDESEMAHLKSSLQRFVGRAEPSTTLAGFGIGAAVLAQCGFYDGYRAAVHWQHAAEAAERNLNSIISTNVFEMDRQRLSSAGGATTLDLMLAWLAERHDKAFCAEVAAQLGIERVRQASERQAMPASAQPAVGSARIKEALELMQANLSEPLPTEDIARLVGISRRQLERLFRQHMDTLPSRYYLELRLKAARRQLKQTSQSILQIGLSCGFVSGPHFSTAYRTFFGHTPREERARHALPGAAGADVPTVNTEAEKSS